MIKSALRHILVSALIYGLPGPAFLCAQDFKFDSDTISGLGARNIGSATMSGRVAAVAAVKENGRMTVYIGSASGGVWKSVNNGTTYKPVFDKQPVQSIGAIAIDPSAPKTVWVGTGEGWTRNSASIGDGVYKSTDGGENWTNMGLKESERISKVLVDPKNGNTVYACVTGKMWSDSDERGVYKTTDGGKSWTKVLSESPRNRDIIWVGTDDGNVQLTRDGGKSSKNVADNVPALPKFSWVSWVEAGRFDEGTAYAAFDRHTFGDMTPYVYKTTDFGATWAPLIAKDSGVRGHAHVIKEDTAAPNLLFAGTEFGLWVSVDGGKQWAQYKGQDFPNVAVRDIVVHPRESDLVLATHGRGIWIVDDITPLRKLTSDVLSRDVAFLEGRPTQQRFNASGGWAEGDAMFAGPNSAKCCLDYLLSEETPHLRKNEDRGIRLRRQAG